MSQLSRAGFGGHLFVFAWERVGFCAERDPVTRRLRPCNLGRDACFLSKTGAGNT